MALRLRITCIIPDGGDADRRIDKIGGSSGGTGEGGRWCIDLDTAIAGIESGKWSFYVMVNGNAVDVIVATRNGRKYLRTVADGDEPNNLLNLPRCP